MSKKDIVTFPSIKPDFGFGSMGNNLPFHDGEGSPNKEAVNSHIEIMNAYAIKTIHATSKMAEIDKHATEKFYETAENTANLQKKAKGKNHQESVDQFSNAINQVAGQQMIGIVKIGSAAIAQEVGRFPHSPPQKEGFLKRLLGD